ncbi:hypothetical protein FDC22_06030 [Clostridium botulinum]|uniref:Phage protein n=1 Tax=Clostridium botulinum (strain Okra / Type B1) TaxID=498213 RepID=B1IJ12_CLOBK|nr:hypothetical protein [Clostridium botulinum]ACA45729.1 conserved hypothetical protein [Clostridium botulinum B1 str. Okra]MBD5564420.1 hypothetical protein [Clostridium botulinum]MBD5566938.1 hypothetical protein [Clostridium botulinum]MBD5570449.1 hypothetical protein [Clostridium botulinum]MBD5577815.1 hypothetical protein [Clostridium botulinum]
MNGRDIKEIGVSIKLDKERHLIFDLNAMCELEEKFESIDAAFEKLSENMKMKDLRYTLWLALKYEDEEITEKEAGRLMTITEIDIILSKLGEALLGSLPEKNEDEKNR